MRRLAKPTFVQKGRGLAVALLACRMLRQSPASAWNAGREAGFLCARARPPACKAVALPARRRSPRCCAGWKRPQGSRGRSPHRTGKESLGSASRRPRTLLPRIAVGEDGVTRFPGVPRFGLPYQIGGDNLPEVAQTQDS